MSLDAQEGKTMNATDFTKNKMHFTIALLATLFALHPFFPTFDQISFAYMGLDAPLYWAFMAIGVLLASAVYCYATDLTSEHPSPVGQRFGNYFYAMALMTVPFYCGMWATTLLEDYLIRQDVFETMHIQSPVITIGILVLWLIIWQVGDSGSGSTWRRRTGRAGSSSLPTEKWTLSRGRKS
jgi:hypothetical protein